MDAVKLQRRAERIATRRFLAEGPNLVEAAARCGLVEEIFVTDAAGARYHSLLADLPVCPVTDRAMKALSETVTPAGLVAVCRLPDTSLDDILAADPALIVVAVDISDPGNAGTLIRLADAMGGTGPGNHRSLFKEIVSDPFSRTVDVGDKLSLD